MTGNANFLEQAVNKSLNWMRYQSPTDDGMVAQQPTSDWRDEQWVLGYGLYVNAIYHSALQLLGYQERADKLAKGVNILFVGQYPYYALWTFKLYHSDRF